MQFLHTRSLRFPRLEFGLSISVFLCAIGLHAQISIYDIPTSDEIDPSVVAKARSVAGNKTDSKAKARAIYRWIGRNISYDHIAAIDRSQRVSAAHVLETGKGICLGYAALYRDMCAAVGIDAFIVSGYGLTTPGSALPDKPNHAWNSILLNGQWYFVDATWGATDPKTEYFAMDRSVQHVPSFMGWERDSCIDLRGGKEACNLKDSLMLFLDADITTRAVLEARSDYLRNPTSGTKVYLGQVLVDRGASLSSRADEVKDSSGLILYDRAIADFEAGFILLDSVRNWQKEAFAMAGLNRSRMYFNTLNGESYNVDNLMSVISDYETYVDMLKKLESSFTASMAIRQAMSDLYVIKSELERIND